MAIPFKRAVGPGMLLVLSGLLAAMFVALWPKPISVVLAGVAGLCLTAAMLVVYIEVPEAHGQLVQFRKALFCQPGFFAVVFLGIAWKYYRISPAFSSASLISAGLFTLGAVLAFILTRPTPARDI